jgi:glycosyltransferase involved in cell wall biosynthesis
VVENVVDAEVFTPPAAPARPDEGEDASRRLLTVAALVPKKGHAHLLEALAELRAARDVTLDLVGDGELRADLQRRAYRLGLASAVRFHGERPKQEVAEFMRQADLFVLPSLVENLPCVLIEAMASGLPWVATAVGAVPELLVGAAATLCPPGEPRALAAAISEALDEREQVDAQELAGRARQRFGYEAVAATWTEVYDQLRGGGGAAAAA